MEHRREVIVVPHTHWDREWYLPFQTFRMDLVDLVDDLLDLLERDPTYAHFQLDGQMAVVDDYLEIRPHNERRLRRLAAQGRLSMGPWYILMDEFLCSGETIVRNLQLGVERASAFAGAMPVGYLPDMFGHVAQMPQLLTQAGLDHAVVWRGVPRVIDHHSFDWEAPDGSVVRTEYLLDGYGNGANLPDDAKELVAQIDHFVENQRAFLPDGEPILWMNGTDHLRPAPWLGRVVAEANELTDRYAIRVGSLDEFLRLPARSDVPSWKGELRSGARANLLMGVASNRVDVKQAAAATERQLERLAEPLCALWLAPHEWPEAFFAEAWRLVIRNSAHDSICACSVDEVCDAVIHRFAEARHIAEGLTKRAVDALVSSMSAAGHVVVNPSARERSGLIEVRLPGHELVPGTQVLKRSGGNNTSEDITRADALILVQTALDNMPELHDAEMSIDSNGVLDIRLFYDPARQGQRYTGPVRTLVAEAARDAPDAPARLTIVTPPSQRCLAFAQSVPGFGWSMWTPGELPVSAVSVEQRGTRHVIIDNDRIRVEVDPHSGTFSINGKGPFGRLVDDGDCGDTYNYNPPLQDTVVDQPSSVAIRVLEQGPLRARVAVDATYQWPPHIEGQARRGETPVAVTTIIEVQVGTDLVRVTTEFDNPCRDHRLRAWFALPERATQSVAECAFATVERPLTAEGGPTERALATYPSRRFICAGGLTVVHEGLLEYELVDLDDDRQTAGSLALTLLRCTGVISRGPMPYRPLPAGPVTPTPGAQMPGRQVLRYAVLLGDDTDAAYVAADEAFTPLLSGFSEGGQNRGPSGSG
ncbi:MAG: hypothetical protein N2037_11945, partial [Acidimicrobiales bacterium]|nr:hypothetical protein [Acidimicrobiales bacterium]